MTTWTTCIDSPVGPLDLVADADGALTHLLFPGEQHAPRCDCAAIRSRSPG